MSAEPIRFIHTADWQLGLRVNFIPGDAGAEVRNARLRTVRRIGEVAKEQEATFVVVAGDVFEHHGLKPATVRKTFDALRDYPCPVYLLPGNHDPLTPESLYTCDLWQRDCPANVHVLSSTEPVSVRDDAVLLPCPILDRQPLEDPTAHLAPDFGPDTGFRIGVAHGGIREILEGMRDSADVSAAEISADTCERGALDYLALGDWHGLLKVNERTWYPGAPDATRFKERRPGHVLLVELAEPGATPRVTERVVESLHWRSVEWEFAEAGDIDALAAELGNVPDKGETLIELWSRGTMDLELHSRFEGNVLGPFADRFLWLRHRADELHTYVEDSDLEQIAAEGWLSEVVNALKQENSVESTGALKLLYRLHREVAQ